VIRRTAHLAVHDTLADWETGHLAVELRTGRFTGAPFDVVTVGETADPVTTMGGMRVLPDITLGALGLASVETLDAYERLFHDGDPSAFPVLAAAGG
jgi:hypothetical protein